MTVFGKSVFSAGLRYGQTRMDRDDGKSVVSGPCFVTGKTHSVIVPTAGLDRWIAGANAQDAMPEVPKEDREFLISGTSPEGWDDIFDDEDDD